MKTAAETFSELQSEILWGESARSCLGNETQGAGAYWHHVLGGKSYAPAENLHGRLGWLTQGDLGWPISVHDGSPGGSFSISLLTQYVEYPKAELDFISSNWLRLVTRIGLNGFKALLLCAQADKTVQWNSWMLSTNLIPLGTTPRIEAVTQTLASKFPDHAILLKNVDDQTDPGLLQRLREVGYRLMTSRIVYYFDGSDAVFFEKSTVKRDMKEFKGEERFRWVGPDDFGVEDATRMAALYRLLYIEKHSRLNPRYTEAFVNGAIRERWLEFHGLRDRDGTLVGVFGFFTLDGILTSVPFIGYDTTLDQETGLYRRLFIGILREISARKQRLNYSSGAGDFKRRRGGVPVVEFNAIYDRHLSSARRAAFGLTESLLNRVARPWLEQSGL